MKKSIPDKWFYFPILVLGSYFIFRLINQSKMLFQFPLEISGDYGSHITQLYFLVEYGFHNFIPHWYNGFTLFLFYPPGWYFYTLPFYWITQNLLFATFFSFLSIFLIIFIAIMIFGKTQGFSVTKRIVFFLFLFANAVSIGNYVRLGRAAEFFALMCLVVLFCTIIYFKNKKLNWKFFLLFIVFYTLLILGHPSVAIISHILLLSLFIVKKFKDKIKIVIAYLISLALSSFWWVPFLINLSPDLNRAGFKVSERLLDFSGVWALTSYVTFLVVGILFFTFFIYWKEQNYSRREFLFFSPVIITGFLFVTRLVIFIPLLDKVYPDVYIFFCLLFSTYFFLSLDKKLISPTLRKFIFVGLIIFPLLSVTVSEVHTPKFVEYTDLEFDTIELLPFVEGRFIIPSLYKTTSHPVLYSSYAAVYFNLSSPTGCINFGTPSSYYFERLMDISMYFNSRDCDGFIDSMKFMNTTDVITYVPTGECDFVKECGLKEVKTKGEVCLYGLKD